MIIENLLKVKRVRCIGIEFLLINYIKTSTEDQKEYK